MYGGPRLGRSGSGGGPRTPDPKASEDPEWCPAKRVKYTRVGTLSEHPQVAARAVRQARLLRALHSVPLGGDIEQDRTSKGRDRGLERRRKGEGTERASGASEQAERLS